MHCHTGNAASSAASTLRVLEPGTQEEMLCAASALYEAAYTTGGKKSVQEHLIRRACPWRVAPRLLLQLKLWTAEQTRLGAESGPPGAPLEGPGGKAASELPTGGGGSARSAGGGTPNSRKPPRPPPQPRSGSGLLVAGDAGPPAAADRDVHAAAAQRAKTQAANGSAPKKSKKAKKRVVIPEEQQALAAQREALAKERKALATLASAMASGNQQKQTQGLDAGVGQESEQQALAERRKALAAQRKAISKEKKALGKLASAMPSGIQQKQNQELDTGAGQESEQQAFAERGKALAERRKALAAQREAVAKEKKALAKLASAMASGNQQKQSQELDAGAGQQSEQRGLEPTLSSY